MQYEHIDVIGKIVSSPSLKKIIPTTGFYRNKECLMLTFRILVQSSSKEEQSFFVRIFHQRAEKASQYLKSGMRIRVNGSTYKKKYVDKNNVERCANILNAEGIWLDLFS